MLAINKAIQSKSPGNLILSPVGPPPTFRGVVAGREDGDVRLRLAMLFGGGPDARETEDALVFGNGEVWWIIRGW